MFQKLASRGEGCGSGVFGVVGQWPWQPVLFLAKVRGKARRKARDINHDGQIDAFYDTALNVSWLSDALRRWPLGFPAGRPIRFWGGSGMVTNLDVFVCDRVAPTLCGR